MYDFTSTLPEGSYEWGKGGCSGFARKVIAIF